jgi:soluble lytic murein transglycosylase
MKIVKRYAYNQLVYSALAISLALTSCVRPAAQPTQTPTPAVSATPAPTATPTPLPSPVPPVRVKSADSMMQLGDLDKARGEYQSALDGSQDNATKAAALIGLGRIAMEKGEYPPASQHFITLIEYYQGTPQQSQALYFLAQVYTEQKDYKQAILAYRSFLGIRSDVIAPFVREKLADTLALDGEYDAALSEYYSLASSAAADDMDRLKTKIGQTYAAKGDHKNAVKYFMEIYNSTAKDAVKADMDLLAGRSYIAMGFPDQANARYQDAVNNYPAMYSSFAALIDLVNANVKVNELNRGIANYFSGQWGLANEALDRYFKNNPSHEGKAHYYKALCLVNMDNYGDAITQLNEVINGHPDDELWHSAWEQKAYTLWFYVDRYDQAARVLLDYVSGYSGGERAADFLYQAGRIYERNQELAAAAATWERMIDEYPTAETSLRGLFLAGVTYYRLKDYVKAETVFQRYLALSNFPADQAGGYLWVGKCQQMEGRKDEARASWQQASTLDKTGYYSIRAAQLLDGRKTFDVPIRLNLEPDLKGEKQLAEVWLREQFLLPADTDLSGVGGLASNPRMQLADAYLELGEVKLATAEFGALRMEIGEDPAANYHLLNHVLDLGLYQEAILTSRHILDLAGMDDSTSLSAPLYFNHIRFGTYYKDAVLPAAAQTGFNPLFLFSVIRQESMFDSYAGSSAGARGLMQIMPQTGKDMAAQVKFPQPYTDQELYRPLVSIILGANYLARQREYFGGDLAKVLAAYNAGPGSETQVWTAVSNNDPDLYVEVIRYSETRMYVMQIAELLNLYQRFYEQNP